MASRGILIVLAWLGVFAASAPAAAPQGSERRAPELEQARERWLALTPEARRRLWRRYEVFRALPEATRERIQRRHARLREIEREIRSEPDHEERFGGMPPRHRRGAMRAMVRERLESEARSIARVLSEERRAELELLPRGRRPQVLRQWVRQELERRERRFLQGRDAPEEPRDLGEHPRRLRVLDLRRQGVLQRMRQDERWEQLPPRVRRWIEDLDAQAFFENFPAIQRHWRAAGGLDPGPPRGPGRGGGDAPGRGPVRQRIRGGRG